MQWSCPAPVKRKFAKRVGKEARLATQREAAVMAAPVTPRMEIRR